MDKFKSAVPIPKYGDLMTMDDFIIACKEGFFINYDGIGNYSDGKFMYMFKKVFPSDVMNGDIDHDFSHIVWFNR